MFRKLIFFFLFAATGSFFVGNFVIGKATTRLVNMSSRLTAPRFELKLKDAKVNLFGGALDLRGLGIKNREEESSNFYLFKRLFVDIDILKILDRKLIVERVLLKDARLLFVKHGIEEKSPPAHEDFLNTDNQTQTTPNTTQPQPKDISQTQAEEQEPQKDEEEPVKSRKIDYTKLAKFLLKNLEVSALVEFEDRTTKPNFRQGLKLKLKAKNISTYPVPGTKAGIIAIHGALKNNSRLFVIKAKATVPPISNPQRPDFDIEATIKRIDVEIFSPYLMQSGITDGTMEIQAKLVCRNGEYVRSKSILKTRISKIKFSEETLSRMPKDITIPKELKFKAHVYGPVNDAKTDFPAALAGVILKKVFQKSLAQLLEKQINK